MAKSKEIIVDSNYLVPLFNANDAHRKRAFEIGKWIESEDVKIAVSSLVFLEAVTVISQRCDRVTAISFGDYIKKSQSIRWINVDEEIYNRSWEIFTETMHKNISFVDCSIIAVARAEGIKDILTFDETDFKKLKKHYRFRIIN